MELINQLAEEYAGGNTSPEDELLQQVAAFTLSNHAHAHMLSGHVQGTFLTILSALIQPDRILEIGTFTGYSALCLAKGLKTGGILHTIELRNEDAVVANSFFQQTADHEKIILHVGNAMEIIPGLNEQWDIVFIDADKTGYIDYYELILPKVRKNGVIIADNVLFHGQVLADPVSGKNARAMVAFNKHVKSDERVQQVMLTVRDGLMLIRKL
jgi:caffeoyl-CoA O-methyltransferase